MKLRDLDAKFVGRYNPADGSFFELGDDMEGAQGILFQCPKCAAGKVIGSDDGGIHRYVEGDHHLLVWFSNPRHATRVPDSAMPGPDRWDFSGDSIDTLTLTPSVDLSKGDPTHGIKPDPNCMWHGRVKNGDAT